MIIDILVATLAVLCVAFSIIQLVKNIKGKKSCGYCNKNCDSCILNEKNNEDEKDNK